MATFSPKLLEQVEQHCGSLPQIVNLRRQLLEESDGLPSLWAAVLQSAVLSFLEFLRSSIASSFRIADTPAAQHLKRVLNVHVKLATHDDTLAEELERSPTKLLDLIRYDVSQLSTLEQQEDVMELQDLACEVVSGKYSTSLSFTAEELRERLPLIFDIVSAEDKEQIESVWIHQVTTRQSAQEDVGFVLWPSTVILARWLVTNPSVLDGKRIIEIGAGCGLAGLVAAQLQVKRQTGGEVLLTDFNDKVLQNLRRNVKLNELEDKASVAGLDFYSDQTIPTAWHDMDGSSHERVDVVLAADMICQPSDATASAQTTRHLLVPGGMAYVVCADSRHRYGVDLFESECKRVGLTVQKLGVETLYGGELLRGPGLELTSGHVEGMQLHLFLLKRPVE